MADSVDCPRHPRGGSRIAVLDAARKGIVCRCEDDGDEFDTSLLMTEDRNIDSLDMTDDATRAGATQDTAKNSPPSTQSTNASTERPPNGNQGSSGYDILSSSANNNSPQSGVPALTNEVIHQVAGLHPMIQHFHEGYKTVIANLAEKVNALAATVEKVVAKNLRLKRQMDAVERNLPACTSSSAHPQKQKERRCYAVEDSDDEEPPATNNETQPRTPISAK